MFSLYLKEGILITSKSITNSNLIIVWKFDHKVMIWSERIPISTVCLNNMSWFTVVASSLRSRWLMYNKMVFPFLYYILNTKKGLIHVISYELHFSLWQNLTKAYNFHDGHDVCYPRLVISYTGGAGCTRNVASNQ